MNYGSIELKLNRHLDVFSKHIPGIQKYKDKLYIAGGAIVSLIQEQYSISNANSFDIAKSLKDIDIYVEDENTLINILRCIIESDIEFKTTEYTVSMKIDGTQYQLITFRTGDPKTVLSNFDFVHTMTYFKSGDEIKFFDKMPNLEGSENLVALMEDVELAILQKKLIMNKSLNYMFTYSRMFKFLNRGYTIKGSWKNDLLLGIANEIKEDPENAINLILAVPDSC